MTYNFENSRNNDTKSPEQIVDELILEVDALLAKEEFQSEEEKNYYLRKLYGALAINNDPNVRDRIKYIEERYN